MSPMGYEGQPQSRRGGIKWLPILFFAGYMAYYYFSNQQVVPVTGRKQLVDMSREQETALGLSSYQQVLSQERLATGPNAEMIKRIGRKLVAVAEDQNYQWEFNLFESPELNAFALPGGKVAYYTGLLAVTSNENAVAAVMGHEIAHVIARHGAERMAQQKLLQIGTMAVGVAVSDMDTNTQRGVLGALGVGAQFGVMLPFSRDHESEADHIGLLLAARACFDPTEATRVWERMSAAHGGKTQPEFMSTHPADGTRIRKLTELMPAALEERAKHCGGQ